MMHFTFIFSVLCELLLLPFQASALNDGLTKAVTWDSGSLMVDNDRVYILAAEFHYERMPVPEMWLVSIHLLSGDDSYTNGY
jgi:beta-galactosidase GanA